MTEADVRRVQEWLDKTQTGHQWLFLDEKLKTVKCHKCDDVVDSDRLDLRHTACPKDRTFTTSQDLTDYIAKLIETVQYRDFEMWAFEKFCELKIKISQICPAEYHKWLFYNKLDSSHWRMCWLISQWLKKGE